MSAVAPAAAAAAVETCGADVVKTFAAAVSGVAPVIPNPQSVHSVAMTAMYESPQRFR